MQLSLHSKVTTIGKRNLQLKSQQLLYFPIQFLCSAASVLSVSLSPPQVSARFYIYHDFATIPLPIQSTMQQKKSQGKKMIEANQRERSFEGKKKRSNA
jgi:hypothetical protein